MFDHQLTPQQFVMVSAIIHYFRILQGYKTKRLEYFLTMHCKLELKGNNGELIDQQESNSLSIDQG